MGKQQVRRFTANKPIEEKPSPGTGDTRIAEHEVLNHVLNLFDNASDIAFAITEGDLVANEKMTVFSVLAWANRKSAHNEFTEFSLVNKKLIDSLCAVIRVTSEHLLSVCEIIHLESHTMFRLFKSPAGVIRYHEVFESHR